MDSQDHQNVLLEFETDEASWQQELPSRLRLLCVCPQEPSWIGLNLQLDGEGCVEPQYRWLSDVHNALAMLRKESFDCILLSDERQNGTVAGALKYDPLAIIRAIRASGCDDPIIYITAHCDDNIWNQICRHDCELLVTANSWDSLSLVPMIKRAMGRIELSRENHRLSVANHRRLIRERDEAEQLLNHQRQMIEELQALIDDSREARSSAAENQLTKNDQPSTQQHEIPSFALPQEVADYYHELLRNYVIMGSGSLGAEIAQLAELLALASLTPKHVLAIHLEHVELLVKGLGRRSTRHVMARADLLALEVMIHLAECYQQNIPSS